MDFGLLYYHELQSLCLRLLRAKGFGVLEPSDACRDVGINFLLLSPSGERWAVVLQHAGPTVITGAQLRDWTNLLSDVRDFLDVDAGLLIFSGKAPARVEESLDKDGRVLLWDEPVLHNFLDEQAEACGEFVKLLERQLIAEKRMPRPAVRSARAEKLIERLQLLSGGEGQGREFESLCLEVFNYAFIPPLRISKTQLHTEHGAAYRTTTYALKYGHAFWDALRSECQTHFVTAGFSRRPDALDRGDVESLRRLLSASAMRSLGLLCGRRAPSPEASGARREAWLEDRKLILFLSADDLKDVLQVKGAGGDPSEILEMQVNEFFAECL